MRAVKQINTTTDYFIQDNEDRQAVKLYLYQSILNLSKTESAHLLGLTARKGYELRQMHLKHFKESEKYRSLFLETERICASDFLKSKWTGFNNHLKDISKRSNGLFLVCFPTKKYKPRIKAQLQLEL